MKLSTMIIKERERLAYTEGFTETAALLGELIDVETERDTLEERLEDLETDKELHLPVRYFVLDYDLDDGPDVVECSEFEFLAADGAITYERHTVWANGVNQICLTKGLDV